MSDAVLEYLFDDPEEDHEIIYTWLGKADRLLTEGRKTGDDRYAHAWVDSDESGTIVRVCNTHMMVELQLPDWKLAGDNRKIAISHLRKAVRSSRDTIGAIAIPEEYVESAEDEPDFSRVFHHAETSPPSYCTTFDPKYIELIHALFRITRCTDVTMVARVGKPPLCGATSFIGQKYESGVTMCAMVMPRSGNPDLDHPWARVAKEDGDDE